MFVAGEIYLKSFLEFKTGIEFVINGIPEKIGIIIQKQSIKCKTQNINA